MIENKFKCPYNSKNMHIDTFSSLLLTSWIHHPHLQSVFPQPLTITEQCLLPSVPCTALLYKIQSAPSCAIQLQEELSALVFLLPSFKICLNFIVTMHSCGAISERFGLVQICHGKTASIISSCFWVSLFTVNGTATMLSYTVLTYSSAFVSYKILLYNYSESVSSKNVLRLRGLDVVETQTTNTSMD